MLSQFPIKKLEPKEFPPQLFEIPEPPKQLYIRGALPTPQTTLLAVVGTRKYTPYGKEICKKLISGLKGYPICIVSGLALGIDAIAHEAALEHNIQTLAIPGSGLSESVLYPRTNLSLAKRILEHRGCLLSEFEPEMGATIWSFPRRNRIMAGLVQAVLVIEGEAKSGTLITARLATEYNKDVLTVPQSVFSPTSSGPTLLLKLGATPIATSEDILEALHITIDKKEQVERTDLTEGELKIVSLLKVHESTKEEILSQTQFDVTTLNTLLMLLEIKGVIKETLGKIHLA